MNPHLSHPAGLGCERSPTSGELTGTSFLKLLGVGLVMVGVLTVVVVVVVVVTKVLGWPGGGALGPPGCCAWACTWARARLPGVVMEPCIFTGGSRDCCPYSIYWTDLSSFRTHHAQH